MTRRAQRDSDGEYRLRLLEVKRARRDPLVELDAGLFFLFFFFFRPRLVAADDFIGKKEPFFFFYFVTIFRFRSCDYFRLSLFSSRRILYSSRVQNDNDHSRFNDGRRSRFITTSFNLPVRVIIKRKKNNNNIVDTFCYDDGWRATAEAAEANVVAAEADTSTIQTDDSGAAFGETIKHRIDDTRYLRVADVNFVLIYLVFFFFYLCNDR